MRWKKIKAKVSSTYFLGGSIQFSIHLGLTGSHDLKILNLTKGIMLRVYTARLNGIEEKYATYSFVQDFTILAGSDDLKSATERMSKVDMDLLREQLAQFHHLRAPEHENVVRSPCTLRWNGWDWIEIYPLAGSLKEVGDESEEEYTADSEAEDAVDL